MLPRISDRLKDNFDATVSIIEELQKQESSGTTHTFPTPTMQGLLPTILSYEVILKRLGDLIKTYNQTGSSRASGKVIPY